MEYKLNYRCLIVLLASSLPNVSYANSMTCGAFLRPGAIGYSSNFNRIERNGSLFGVQGSYLVDFSRATRRVEASAPISTAISTKISMLFPAGYLQPYSVTEIFVIRSFDQVSELTASVSGKVSRRKSDFAVVDFDTNTDFQRIYLLESAFGPKSELKDVLSKTLFDPRSPAETLKVPGLKRRKLGPLVRGPKQGGSVHVGGLISISAEPPEGFFAASTAAELEKSGWNVSPAAQADIWIYRVPDSRKDSYFDFNYASPDRPVATSTEGKFKVATGIGPSTQPASSGGREADLLWLGDEQMGQLDRYLGKISARNLQLEDLYIERGIVQRVSDRAFVLAGVDHRYALTQTGFDAMETNPELYRRVYDKEYDRFLTTLFKDSHPDPKNKSFLLATSRGCSQGCAICCSGGLSQFQYFSAPRMMEELEKLASYSKMKAGERLNIFFVDSNFNNNPSRIIEFANLYQKSPLYGRFDFFIRHNTVNGFLKSAENVKVPNEELIDAYRTLGVKEIFMGIDSFDDASTVTLKTHKFKVAKDGADSRPIYRSTEVAALMQAFDQRGLYSKGFFLTNNPWVSDFDRIDSYYNLIDLWLENPRFSIDSARDRNVIRLKPFDGSPIGESAKLMGNSLVENGMFVARTPLGEIDETMDFAGLGRPRSVSDTEATLIEFSRGINRIKALAEKLSKSSDSAKQEYGRQVLAKLIDRDHGFSETLKKFAVNSLTSPKIRLEIQTFASRHAHLPKFDPAIQKKAFEENVKSLEDGLRKTNPKKGSGL